MKLQCLHEMQNKIVKGIRGAQYPGQAQVLLTEEHPVSKDILAWQEHIGKPATG